MLKCTPYFNIIYYGKHGLHINIWGLLDQLI